MMRETPRTFVGTVVLLLDGPVCRHVVAAVHDGIAQLPGVCACDLDVSAGTVVVTADAPVDRGDVVALLDRLGCPVRT